jgi:CRISPR-associated endonuclease/helicase Cas3
MTTTRLWPDWLNDVWAKSAERGVGGQPESLAQHTWSVLEKLAETIHLRPGLPKALSIPRLWHCLFWACFLHDFGKAAQGFQARLRGGDMWPHRHEVLSLAFLDWVTSALSDEECRWVAAAIASHHRDASELEHSYAYLWLSSDDGLAERIAELPQATLHGLWRWLSECSASWIEAFNLGNAEIQLPILPSEAEAVRAVCEQGSTRATYWLKAYLRFVKNLGRQDERGLVIGTLALRGHLISSDHMASAHTGDLPSSLLGAPRDLLIRLQINPANLYAHQRQCAITVGSAVLTAPTGSGKTEAALLWTCAQATAQQSVPRLFYTLPYQASMNAMYDRLSDTSRGAFPGQVGLEHSRSVLALYRRFLDQDYTPGNAERAARWGKNLARLNYYPVRVLSPYQMLKGPFRLKGYETLLNDYFDAVFVMDEVHAYEAARLALILGTVKYLRQNFGARFFVMSATLPTLLVARLVEALGDYTPIQASSDLFAQFRRHLLRLMEGDLLESRWLAHIVQVAHSGQAVLVCCNTVKRAQMAYDEIKRRLEKQGSAAKVVLLHGRFNGQDRLEKEKEVREATGSQAKSRRSIVLVATQVVEVSLDIDLDVIYTDPAPLEALIQRFGRINRRRLKERAPVCVFTRPDDGQFIYDADLVRAALNILQKHAEQMIDEAGISDWLTQVYQGQIAEKWNQAYQQSYFNFCNGPLATLRAFNSDPQLEDEFYRAFDSVEVLPSGYEAQYNQMRQDEPIAASQLLVPIRWQQFSQLKEKGRAREGEAGWPGIVDANYDAELGLQLG